VDDSEEEKKSHCLENYVKYLYPIKNVDLEFYHLQFQMVCTELAQKYLRE